MRFIQRIGREAGHVHLFGRPWQHLQQQRIARVAWSHPGDEPPRHEQGKRAGGTACIGRDGGIERQQSAEFVGIADGIGQFSLPDPVGLCGKTGFSLTFGRRRQGGRVGEWQGGHGCCGWAVVLG